MSSFKKIKKASKYADCKNSGKGSLLKYYGVKTERREFSTGLLLKHYNVCPWDYSRYPLNYKGVIRLDYAPLWFCTGLLFEKILSHEK